MNTQVLQKKLSTTMGERDSLWDVVVKWDDICFKHILPRLNRTDVKFLGEVNSESRKLIKRSSRASDLKKRFKVEEMSSVSTLEFMWENRWLWPGNWDGSEISFCVRVAQTNKLDLLKWAREEKKCEWNVGTINMAASQGNLEMLKYCVSNKCPIDMLACIKAAENGHLECLKYLHEEVKVPWAPETAYQAAGNGHLHILEYLVDRKYFKYNVHACTFAAREGQLDCLKYLHEVVKAPWDSRAVEEAHRYNRKCLQYLLDNDCPLPFGWYYENGELYITEEEEEEEEEGDLDEWEAYWADQELQHEAHEIERYITKNWREF